MTFIYNCGIFLYSMATYVASLFHQKAKLFVQGRKNWEQLLGEKVDTNSEYIWFHCASLGEFEQGRPVIEEIRKQFPAFKIALTFFSPSGYEIRKNYDGADLVMYLPLDSKGNARKFLDVLKPAKAFFVKYEYWYNYIRELQQRQIPLFIISAIFREDQVFFRNHPWGHWYRKMLFAFAHIFIQDEKSAALLQSIGIRNFTIAGDTRFDRVAAIARGAKKFPSVEKFKGSSPVVIAGSTWKPDEELLADFINKSTGVKFIIAPHEVSASNINRIHQLLKKRAVSFSKVQNSDFSDSDVLIIDSIGILSSLYQYGNVAYIGGGFGVGIHNILEAATFKLPIIFGPNYLKFKEAVDLADQKGAFPISDQNTLNSALKLLLDDKTELEKASAICKNYVEKNVGSTKLIINKVFNI
jgi:3-deoxy-D-manno-octulosonic-acid transferase